MEQGLFVQGHLSVNFPSFLLLFFFSLTMAVKLPHEMSFMAVSIFKRFLHLVR